MEKKPVKYALAIGSLILTVLFVEYVHELRASNYALPFLGVLPNFIAATFGIFIFVPFVRSRDVIKCSFYYCIGLTFYEFLQMKITSQTFDVSDVFATWIGFILSIFLFKASSLLFLLEKDRSQDLK